MNLVSSLLSTLDTYLDKSVSQITLAYSGGVDSHVLLHCLTQHLDMLGKVDIQALYINHGLSPNAQYWQDHCQRECQTLGVRFKGINVTVDRNSGLGLEAAARQARYDALIGATCDNGMVLLAQHADDQLETMLLQLKRGAGPQGLAGMPLCRTVDRGIRLCRPFLLSTKQNIVDYANQNNLRYVEDESNDNDHFDRNFLRNQVIPLLIQRWPSVQYAASRSARLCWQQQQLLDEVTEHRLQVLIDEQHRLNAVKLCDNSEAWQNQIIRQWLAMHGVQMPSEKQLEQIRLMLGAKEDATPLVDLSSHQIRRFDGLLYCVEVTEPLLTTELKLNQHNQIVLPYGGLILSFSSTSDAQATEIAGSLESLQLRFNEPMNQRFKPLGKAHSKPLKQWYKQWKIPPWQRAKVGALYSDECLVALIVKDTVIVNQNALDELFERIYSRFI